LDFDIYEVYEARSVPIIFLKNSANIASSCCIKHSYVDYSIIFHDVHQLTYKSNL